MAEQCCASGQFGAEQQSITTRQKLDLTKLKDITNDPGSLQFSLKDP